MTNLDIGSLSADQMLALVDRLQTSISAAAPALIRETVTDDGETYDALRCPVCQLLVNDGGDLFAISIASRHSPAEPDMDHDGIDIDVIDEHEHRWSRPLYLLHDVQTPGNGSSHVVSAPDGWRLTT